MGLLDTIKGWFGFGDPAPMDAGSDPNDWLQADGIDCEVLPGGLNDFTPGLSDFSYSYWIQTTIAPLEPQMTIHDNNGNTLWLELDCAPDDVTFGRYQVYVSVAYSTQYSFYGTTVLTDGQPHLVAVTCKRNSTTGLNIYVDGMLQTTGDPTPFQLVNFVAGSYGTYLSVSGVGQLANGVEYLDQFRFYKGTILTLTQIQMIYNSGNGVKVNETAFKNLTNNGFYAEIDEGTGAPVGRLLTAGAWTSSPMSYVSYLGTPVWVPGGVPFGGSGGGIDAGAGGSFIGTRGMRRGRR